MALPTQFFIHNDQGPSGFADGKPYTGPVAGIKTELDLSGQNSWNVQSLTDDVFISISPRVLDPTETMRGPPLNFIDVSGQNGNAQGSGPIGPLGNNIVNGGNGSSFIVGGAGDDTFFVDGRATPSTDPKQNIWSTLKGLHSGDAATVWGVTQQDWALTWLPTAGAPGAANQGLTAVFVQYGQPEIGVTFAGLGMSDLISGHIATSFGRTADLPGLPGSNYFHVDVRL